MLKFLETPDIFDNEFDLAKTEGFDGMKVVNIKRQVIRFVIPDVHRVLVLASMPRHPS